MRSALSEVRLPKSVTSTCEKNLYSGLKRIFDVQLPFAVPKSVTATPGQIFGMLRVFWIVFSAKRASVGASIFC